MKSIGVMSLFLVSGALVQVFANDNINSIRQPKISDGNDPLRFRRAASPAASMPASKLLGLDLGGLIDATGLTSNKTVSTLLSNLLNGRTVGEVQKLLNSVTKTDVQSVLEDSGPVATLLDSIPIVGSVLALLRSILGLVGNLLDRVIDLVVDLLHFLAEALPKLLA